ncbi:hypothetical protein [Mobiluncus mulieris]|uniref:hypothetical protein n=1 Tax=Mobiluncus mulieris TaxID=2052 RepID=UPI00019F92D7|nr:hypothetical protein [Mobiluncus mulieris]EEJ52800.1 hypothetical protein HMPREF0577_2113 [Mobiluncus mulieris ATCC 35243]
MGIIPGLIGGGRRRPGCVCPPLHEVPFGVSAYTYVSDDDYHGFAASTASRGGARAKPA